MQTVNLSFDNQVATLCFDRADTHNAFNAQMIREIREAIALVNDSDARVLVIKAAGKSFSAGADLNWMRDTAKQSPQENEQDARELAAMLSDLYYCPIATIAQIQGNAFGGGVGLIACCDIAIACERAKLALSEVKLGLIPATISPYVVQAIGPRAAKALFITGQLFDASRAHQLGLVHQVCADEGELSAAVAATIAQVLSNGPQAIGASKALVDSLAGEPIDEAQQHRLAGVIASVRASDEGQEGLTAFLEKRPAAFNQTALRQRGQS